MPKSRKMEELEDFVLRGGLVNGQITSKGLPNEGMRRSVRSALVGGLYGGLTGGLIGGLVGALVGELDGGLDGRLLGGLLFGLGGALGGALARGGLACLRHLVLRYLLVRNNLAPWKYATFLDYAADRIFLRKVGGGYIFVHRLLLEWFAGQAPEGGAAKK